MSGFEGAGLGEIIATGRLAADEMRRLATRVGCFEELASDPRVLERLREWLGGSSSREDLDEFGDPRRVAEMTEAAYALASEIGLPARWLAGELVQERRRHVRAMTFDLDPIRLRTSELDALLEDAASGTDQAPSAIRIDVTRRRSETNAELLDRVELALARAGYHRLRSHAAHDPDGTGAHLVRHDSISSARDAGVVWYLTELRRPPLRGQALLRATGLTAPRVSQLRAEAQSRLEDRLQV